MILCHEQYKLDTLLTTGADYVLPKIAEIFSF